MCTPPIKMWKDLSPEEKGALLLARQEGKTIQYESPSYENRWLDLHEPIWTPTGSYRVKPEKKVVTKRLHLKRHQNEVFSFTMSGYSTHIISFNTVDGEVDCSSVKMEKV